MHYEHYFHTITLIILHHYAFNNTPRTELIQSSRNWTSSPRRSILVFRTVCIRATARGLHPEHTPDTCKLIKRIIPWPGGKVGDGFPVGGGRVGGRVDGWVFPPRAETLCEQPRGRCANILGLVLFFFESLLVVEMEYLHLFFVAVVFRHIYYVETCNFVSIVCVWSFQY